jgi:phosphoribosylformylglycinamidine synthase
LDTEGKDYGAIAYSLGIAPKLSDIDAYHSAQRSFIDMVGKIVAIGGALPDMEKPKWDAWAVCGNYCQPDSDSSTVSRENAEHNLASLVREGMGIRDAIEATNIPVISGKDSMKCSCTYDVDESFRLKDVPPDLRKHITIYKDKAGKKKIEIHDPDSYLASCAVKIVDYRKCVNSAFKERDDLIYIVGETLNHLGASQYLNAIGYNEWGMPLEGGFAPEAGLREFVRDANAVHNAIDKELVASCGYIHNGGIAVALAKAAMAGGKGARIGFDSGMPDNLSSEEVFLYSETPGRFVVTVSANDAQRFEKALGNVPYWLIGKVTDEQSIMLKRQDGTTEEASLQKVKESYQKPLRFGLDACRKVQ